MRSKILVLFAISFSLLAACVNAQDFEFKWEATLGLGGYIGPVSKDIDGDGIHEIFAAGLKHGENRARLVSIDGLTGQVNWAKEWRHGWTDIHIPCAIADLDNNGDYEIVCAAMIRTIALNAEDGSVFWNVTNPSHWSQLAIADIDGNGFPYVYVVTCSDGGGSNRILKLNGIDGSIAASHSSGCSCYGGISIADLEGDGEYEILLGTNRVQCFDEDLNQVLWQVTGISCSSHAPAIIDVNNDGILDVISMYQSSAGGYTGGVCVIDGSTGEKMPGKCESNVGIGAHVQPAIHDIDKDGNIELIACFSTYPKVWDLGSWSLDWTSPEKCAEPPDFANVYGDEDLELIAPCAWVDAKTEIYDSSYTLVAEIQGAYGGTLVQDIDGDGKNEILFTLNDSIKAYETPAYAPTPRVRTDTTFYSERRLASGVYIPPIGGGSGPPPNQPPTFSGETPSNGQVGVSIGLSTLSVSITDPDGDSIDWTISTSPDVGSDSGSGAGGIKTCSMSGLDYSTTYTWTVTADDGEDMSSDLYTFTTESQIVPGSASRKVTVNSSYVDEVLSGFPLLVHLDSDAHLDSSAESDGSDISFWNLDNSTQYSHEIEYYDSGTLYAWVSVPSVSASADTEFWMKYGGDDGNEDPESVWSSFVGVWHLDEQGDVEDSTANNNDGTKKSSSEPSQVSGILLNAQDFDGVDDYINCGQDSSLDITSAITAEAWVFLKAQSGYNRILDKSRTDAFAFRTKWDGKIELPGNYGGTGQSPGFSSSGLPQGEWGYVAATYDGSTIRYYINGAPAGTAIPDPSGDMGTSIFDFNIGSFYNGTDYNFNGSIDEVRISENARSATWIKASYHSMVSLDFLSVGDPSSEETNVLPTVSLVSPVDGNSIEDTTPDFSFTVEDSDDDNASCTLYVDSTSKATDTVTSDGSPITFTSSELSYGTHSWYVTCSDGKDATSSPAWSITLTESGGDNGNGGNGGNGGGGNGGNGVVVTPPIEYNIEYNLSNISQEQINYFISQTENAKKALEKAGFDAENLEGIASKTKQAYKNCVVSLEVTRPEPIKSEIKVKFACNATTPLEDVIVFVEIPKSFSQTSQEITVTSNPSNAQVTVLQEDPVYSFYHETLSLGEATYTFSMDLVCNPDEVASEWKQPWFFLGHEDTIECGNNIKEEGEECDGEDGVPSGYICTEECKLEKPADQTGPFCGNGIKENQEECDGQDGVPEDGYWCDYDCTLHFPGEGQTSYYREDIDIAGTKISFLILVLLLIGVVILLAVLFMFYYREKLKNKQILSFRKDTVDELSKITEKAKKPKKEKPLKKPSVPTLDDIDSETPE